MYIISLLLAAVARVGLGMAWYSPAFLGKPWQKATGLTDKKMQSKEVRQAMAYKMPLAFLVAFVQASIIKYFMATFLITTFFEVTLLATTFWVGFTAATQIGSWFWHLKPIQLFVIEAGESWAALNLMSWVLLMIG